MIAIETSGTYHYATYHYRSGDSLVFGSETRGLATEVLASIPEGEVLKLPMVSGSRSLNLSNAAAIVLYEAWRQLDFAGAE